jgi:hypothetical protein
MLIKNVGNISKILMRKNVGKLPKKCWQHFLECWPKNIGNTSKKCWWEKMLANFQKMLTRKNVEEKYGSHLVKNADEKMLTTLKKMLTKKCSQHFQKC